MSDKPNPHIEKMKLDAAMAGIAPELKAFQDDVVELCAKHPDIMFIMIHGRIHTNDTCMMHTVGTEEDAIAILKRKTEIIEKQPPKIRIEKRFRRGEG